MEETECNSQSPRSPEPATTKSYTPWVPLVKIKEYNLLSKLGEGGMGLVYLAEQKGQIKRMVALKVLRPGTISKQVIARFEAERQALALLDHANIAQIYDAGTAETGNPYFAMEYVKGLPITEYCDKEKLGIEARLKLFLQVCAAIQHAHQKGIIHRDIKPSNIIVTIQNDQAIPKVIDFGIAKAVGQPLTQQTLFTEQGQLLGTLEYMSPEQAEMTGKDIDTRSDVYSLGVLLYELLAGALPFDRKTFRSASIPEMQRMIRDVEPPHPSARLSMLGDQAARIADLRTTNIAKLTQCLSNELEWIPLKAMRKDRKERYRSVAALADDIQNYINGLPLIAGPESVLYRIRKLVNRHRAGTIIATMFSVTILSMSFISIYSYGEARRAAKTMQKQRDVYKQTAAQNLALANQVLFQLLLGTWHDGENPMIVSIAEGLRKGSREEVAAKFLLDPSELVRKQDRFRQDLAQGEEAFCEFVIAEHYYKEGNKPAAIKAYSQCLDKNTNANELNRWFINRAKRNLNELLMQSTSQQTDPNAQTGR